MYNKDVPGFCAAPYTTKYHSIPELNNILKIMVMMLNFLNIPKKQELFICKYYKAWIKDILKNIFFLTNKGELYWERLRKKSLGKTYPLPKKIHNGKYFIH